MREDGNKQARVTLQPDPLNQNITKTLLQWIHMVVTFTQFLFAIFETKYILLPSQFTENYRNTDFRNIFMTDGNILSKYSYVTGSKMTGCCRVILCHHNFLTDKHQFYVKFQPQIQWLFAFSLYLPYSYKGLENQHLEINSCCTAWLALGIL